jgi:hypothetical protein
MVEGHSRTLAQGTLCHVEQLVIVAVLGMRASTYDLVVVSPALEGLHK